MGHDSASILTDSAPNIWFLKKPEIYLSTSDFWNFNDCSGRIGRSSMDSMRWVQIAMHKSAVFMNGMPPHSCIVCVSLLTPFVSFSLGLCCIWMAVSQAHKPVISKNKRRTWQFSVFWDHPRCLDNMTLLPSHGICAVFCGCCQVKPYWLRKIQSKPS